jgi:hypothetical protein
MNSNHEIILLAGLKEHDPMGPAFRADLRGDRDDLLAYVLLKRPPRRHADTPIRRYAPTYPAAGCLS